MSSEVQPSLWESTPVVGVIATTPPPAGVASRHPLRVSKTAHQLPRGQHLAKSGRRWRAFWQVVDAEGRTRRRSARFTTEREALAHLDTLPRRAPEAATARRTLGDAVASLRERGRGGDHPKWVEAECADLLSVALDDPKLAHHLDLILKRRAHHRQPQGMPSVRWELACEVRRTDTGWEKLTDTGWEAIAVAPQRAAVFAPKLDALLTHLAAGRSGLERDLPVTRETLRVHKKGSAALRGVLRRVEVLRQPTQAVSRRTVLACRSMLAAALPFSLRDALTDPREVKGGGESSTRHRKRTLTRSLGGRGLEPDPVMLERVLREARRVGAAPLSEGESVTHLNARRALALIAASGMRSGEARALQWRDLDLTANRLWIESSLDQQTGVRKSPKTDESQREVRVEYRTLRGLTDGLLDDLRAWRGDAPDTAWVFPREDGQPMRREAMLDALAEMVQQLGLPKGLRVHDLRHCFARYALHLCDWKTASVTKQLGHASEVITLTLYGSPVAGLPE